MDSSIIFTEANSIDAAQKVREIRNKCKDYMTRSSNYISEEEQEVWFKSLDKENHKLFLMHICYHGAAIDTIGFGYCYHKEDAVFLTGGLLEDCRNKGYGKTLFQFLINQGRRFKTPIRLEVLNDNIRAKKLYEKIGFKMVRQTDKITEMEFVDDRPV